MALNKIEDAPNETDVLCKLKNGDWVVLGRFNGEWLLKQDPFGKSYDPIGWTHLPPD